ncbi:sterol desaturase family protein [Chitinivorax sp. B]|uniref:sterol desaturase family protein n=1 Tax=Chitinivorax sp. B TaxID=2502235 RepID=UPI0010F94B9D|nr:sterol desaturase family protein [Chitinivorax sp. B]
MEYLTALAEYVDNLLVILLPIELFRRWRLGQLNRACLKEMLASVSPLIPTLLLGGITTAYLTVLFMGAAKLAPWRIPTNPLTIFLAFLLVDFLYYVDHRCGHEIRAYWALSHSVHHSSPQYDQTTGLRISFIDGFTSPWFYLPAFLLGFNPALVVGWFAFVLAYQQWIHTETIGKLKWLDPWLNTPSNHRVHHGTQPHYLDKNYGAVLIIWDRLFGTYQKEEETVIYGLTQPIQSSNPFEVHLCEAKRLWHDLHHAPTWLTRLQYLYHKPGWQPASSAMTKPNPQTVG